MRLTRFCICMRAAVAAEETKYSTNKHKASKQSELLDVNQIPLLLLYCRCSSRFSISFFFMLSFVSFPKLNFFSFLFSEWSWVEREFTQMKHIRQKPLSLFGERVLWLLLLLCFAHFGIQSTFLFHDVDDESMLLCLSLQQRFTPRHVQSLRIHYALLCPDSRRTKSR